MTGKLSDSPAVVDSTEVLREWEIHTVNSTNFPLAVCLDGSPGAYYVRRGSNGNSEAEKVLFFFQGGGWCSMRGQKNNTVTDCLARANTFLGSTKKSFSTMMLNQGYLSTDPKVNPAFHDWTTVYVRMCEGSSFSGRVLDPLEVMDDSGKNTSLYFRGNYILEAIAAETLSSSVRNISHVVVGGASSGGLTAFLHGHQVADWVQNKLQAGAGTKVAYFPEVGFFPDWKNPAPPSSEMYPYSYSELMKFVYEENNVTDTLPKQCLEERSKDEYYECMLAQNVVQYLDQPYFIVQSDYDSYQLPVILGWSPPFGQDYLGPPPVSWSEVRDYATNLRKLLVDGTKNPLASPTGVFLPACYFHAAEFSDDLYVNITSQGIAYNEAIAMWVDEWLKDGGDKDDTEKRHYTWIHDANELPIAEAQCAAGLMMNDKGTSAAGNAPQSILCWFIVVSFSLLKAWYS
jgi:hypothetical protein